MKIELEKIAKTIGTPKELDRRPSEIPYEYLRRATLYMNGVKAYKETLR